MSNEYDPNRFFVCVEQGLGKSDEYDWRKHEQQLVEATWRLGCSVRVMDRTGMVAQFHREVTGAPVKRVPEVPNDERVRLRLRLIAEEFFETIESALDCSLSVESQNLRAAKQCLFELIDEAPVDVDLPEFADGLADLSYVIEGAALEFGIPANEVFAEVHAANMRKANGPVREDGKRLKGSNWQPPDVAGVLKRAGWNEGT